MTSARQLTFAAVLCAVAACAAPPGNTGPVPLSVTPGQSTGEAPVPVEIVGRNFDANIHADLTTAAGATMDVRFTVELEPEGGGTLVPLEGVALTGRRTLAGTVPAGLARGVYRLHVTDPRFRTGVLEEAFRIVTPSEAVTSFSVELLETPQAGIGFNVAVTALDAQGAVVDGFDGAVRLTDASGAMASVPAGPFVRGRYRGTAAIGAISRADQLIASDDRGRSGRSAAFDVVAGAPTAVVFPERSVATAAGACSPRLDIELRDVLGHPAPALAPVTAQLQSAPADAAFFSDAACTAAAGTVTIPAGASRASFYLKPGAAGAVTVRVVPDALPSASQDEAVAP